MSSIHKPQQHRSKVTLEKLLDALEVLLFSNFFAQITIRDIAAESGLSTATIYRRFENKEAMLPVLYERFDNKFQAWAKNIWNEKSMSEAKTIQSRVDVLISEHIDFYKKNKAILRTLYLYIRLNGELSLPQLELTRSNIYQRLFAPILALLPDEKLPSTLEIRMIILVLLSTIGERVLFEDNKPSTLLKIDEHSLRNELMTMILKYLN